MRPRTAAWNRVKPPNTLRLLLENLIWFDHPHKQSSGN